ncbi:MAG: phosphatase PAP2 family protein [Bacteroidetes bacterium]|nr:phosphatase PAP2 family protein [Rhodothermia bacterium]MCX7907610.1 phosphatase PAP2 family protein [Bacteroidota bacterium]MDW8286410.1 phosphatase PAP2 family protein [Bacteroidota bacterium]
MILSVGLLCVSLVAAAEDSSWWLRQDVRLLRAINGIEDPIWGGLLSAANASAYPVFLGAPLSMWATGFVRRDERWLRAGIRLALIEGVVAGAVFGLKRAIGRKRPYWVLLDLRRSPPEPSRSDSYAMPSGHAALAFAVATGGALEARRWAVSTSLYAWAALVALARPYYGAHYPSDVIVGAALGAGLSWGVREALRHWGWP